MNISSNTSRRGIKPEIFRLHSLGFNYTQIQNELNCSRGTISHHLSNFIKEQKKTFGDNKKKLIDEIKSNLPQSREEFDDLYSDKLTTREKSFFHSSFYKLPNKGLKNGEIPKEYYKDRRKNIKKDLIDYKGGCCCICGYNKSYRSLHFHHLNPKEKDFTIGAKWGKLGFNDEIKKELDKCILVCANCHGEIHDGLIKI